MNQWTKIFIAIGTVLFVAVLILLVMILQFDSGACENNVHQEYISPDNTLKAVVFERNCGGDKFSTQISIIGSFESLGEEAGDVLILNGRAMQVAPKIKWNHAAELTVYHRLTGEEYKVQKNWKGKKEVRINFAIPKDGMI